MAVSLRKPVCFVLIPFGEKTHPDSGASVDFDAIYEGTLRPALHNAGMDPVRLDQEVAGLSGSSIQERVMGAEFALADVTTRDPAILFLLGARAERMPGTTLVVAARGSEAQLTTLTAVRVLVYDLDGGNRPGNSESLRLRKLLSAALSEMRDSALSSGSTRGTMSTDVQERATRGAAVASAIEQARDTRDKALLKRLEDQLISQDPQSPLLLNIFQAYRELAAWEAMVELFERLPHEMRNLPRVRQQAGLALNQMGRHDDAVALLSSLLKENEQDSETLGILGRVHKDLWFKSKEPAALNSAIESYLRGFEANRKDAYPGINAVTLLEIRGGQEAQETKRRILPLVTAAVQDQMKLSRRPTYWDYATQLELAVLAGDESQARHWMNLALRIAPETWFTETTANNLKLIHDARGQRGEQQPWLDRILTELHTSVTA